MSRIRSLGRLRLTVVGLLATHSCHAIVFLNSRRRTVFSFVNTGVSALAALGRRTSYRLRRLSIGRHSPGCLLSVFGAFTTRRLRVSPTLLPSIKLGARRGPLNGRLKLLCDRACRRRIHSYIRFTDQLDAVFPRSAATLIIGTGHSTRSVDNRLAHLNVKRFGISNSSLFSSPRLGLLLTRLDILGGRFYFLT